MVNEEILTSLRNAIERGASLQDALNLAIKSGYNPKDVQEASMFLGGGVLTRFQPKPKEQLILPAQKNVFGKPKIIFPAQKIPETQQQYQPIKQSISQDSNAIKENITQRTFLSKDNIDLKTPIIQKQDNNQMTVNAIKKPSKNSFKEIFLLIILILLVGILIATFLFKDYIIAFFSQL